MFNKIILLFFIFGCWLKYLEYPANAILHNMWGIMVITWAVLNFFGIFSYLAKKKPRLTVSEKTKSFWFAENLMATLSFWMADEPYMTILFVCSSVVFMFLVFFMAPKKNK